MNKAITRLVRTTAGRTSDMDVAQPLTIALIPLVALAAAAGLLFPSVYARNPATIIPAPRGQDLVMLLALPALAVALRSAARGSPREILVYLGMLGYMGYTYTGAALVLVEGTVKNHLTNILGQLGARERAQAVLIAKDLGII